MGLLDSFNPNFASSPQFQQGLLAMALASGNPRQAAGVQGLLQMQMHQEDRAAKQALLNQKIAEQQKKDNFFGGLMSNGVGNMTPEQVLQAKQYNVDAMPAVEYAKRGVQVQPGNGYIGQNGQFTYVPQVDKGIMLNPDGSAAPVSGYAQANADIQKKQTAAQELAKVAPQTALARNQAYIKAASTPMQGVDSNGNPAFTSEAAQLGMRDPTQGGNGQQSPLVEGGLRPGMTNQQKASQQATEQLNSNWVTNNYNPTIAAAGAAGDILTNVRVSRDAMKNMGGTGWGTDVKAQAANMLTSLGIGGENAKLYATNAQTFNQAAMGRLQTVLNAAKGPQTEGDAQRAMKTYAQLGNTTEANAFILNLMEAQAQRDIMKSEFYQQAMPLARSRGDLTEVDREWQKRQPSVYSMPSMAQYNK